MIRMQISPRVKGFHEPKPGLGELPRRKAKISVVVPARNEEAMLPTCLAALRQQSLKDFELIVVDSASSDHTGADAIPSPEWLERLVVPFRNPEVVGTFGTLQLTGKGVWAGLGQPLFTWSQGVNFHLGRPLFCGPNFAVSKAAFHAVGGFKGSNGYPEVAEDVWLARKLKKRGKIVFLRDLKMFVSARSLQGGRALGYIGHHAGGSLKGVLAGWGKWLNSSW
jgi:cellulose synthase/poly-beta-1,6-N-acetylglucosamine synthase-like glycosyltransferase